jgi:flagellar biogenesis protein FliO
VRREDLLKPDVMSEVILIGVGALIFVILLILIAAWTQAPALL